MGNELPDISVVIPSVGRPELARALTSVRAQDYQGRVEILVVFDLAEAGVPESALTAAAVGDRILFTGGQRRGGYARNLGVKQASGGWIAFLDDDDEWSPQKLRLQMDIAISQASRGLSPIVGCRVQQIVTKKAAEHVVSGIPNRLIRPEQRVEEYLFVGRRPGAKRASFFTSTILAKRSLCLSVPWDASLSRHQDWDWLTRAGQVSGVTFHQSEEVLATYYVGTQGSISAGAAWKGSHDWAHRVLEPLSTRVFVDFVTAQTLRYAFQKRDWPGVSTVLKSIFTARKVPSLGPICIGAAGLLPRATFQNLMRKIR
ncbi:glycosyltransferase [Paenarthrobacter nicotinovorans]|uniref:glycosyltransferase n=1 Tax=Paenarthrobacter nicotinovorans TaxID=29320 RepID=UPI003D6640E2